MIWNPATESARERDKNSEIQQLLWFL